jgi:hypothetical protein
MTSQRFHFIREGNNPVACIAVQLDRDTNVISYGVSVRHPDEPAANYSKAQARTIASGRLHKRPLIVPGAIPQTAYAISRAVMEDLIKRDDVFVKKEGSVVVKTFGVPNSLRDRLNDWLVNANKPRA